MGFINGGGKHSRIWEHLKGGGEVNGMGDRRCGNAVRVWSCGDVRLRLVMSSKWLVVRCCRCPRIIGGGSGDVGGVVCLGCCAGSAHGGDDDCWLTCDGIGAGAAHSDDDSVLVEVVGVGLLWGEEGATVVVLFVVWWCHCHTLATRMMLSVYWWFLVWCPLSSE